MKENQILKQILIVLILFCSFTMKSQKFVNSLFGLRLGQYKDCVVNRFGNPFQANSFEDGWTYQAFIVTADSSLYLVTESTKEQPDLIQSIQLSGKRSVLPIFKGLRIGDSKSVVFNSLGQPIDSVNIDEEEIKAVRYEFENSNYSVEIAQDRLYSIKIQDNSSQLFKMKSDIPDFKTLLKLFSKKNNELLFDIFCADIEVVQNGEFYSFKYPYIDELNDDKSGIFKILMNSQNGLSTLKMANLKEENIRISENQPPQYVFKLKNHAIQEIVFKESQGLFRIWEIKYK